MRVIRLVVLAFVVVLCVLLVQQASASPPRELLTVKLRHSSQVVAFFDHRGKWLRATRHERCSDVPWAKSCVRARSLYLKHRSEARRLHRALWLHLPAPNDWRTAVRVVQRVYPGTEGWLLSCSSAESSHGAWVWNGSLSWRGYLLGDRAGGWLQFRHSTFVSNWDPARTAAGRRGFVIPELGEPFISPLAQALTGGWMRYTHRDASHWSASWGRGC